MAPCLTIFSGQIRRNRSGLILIFNFTFRFKLIIVIMKLILANRRLIKNTSGS